MSEAKGQGPGKGRRSQGGPERYWTGAHTTHKLRFHLVFVPKYRKRVLRGPVAVRLEELLRQACEVNGWEPEELAIQPDHVHLLVQAQPRYSVSRIANVLKGGHEPGAARGVPGLGGVPVGQKFLGGRLLRGDGGGGGGQRHHRVH